MTRPNVTSKRNARQSRRPAKSDEMWRTEDDCVDGLIAILTALLANYGRCLAAAKAATALLLPLLEDVDGDYYDDDQLSELDTEEEFYWSREETAWRDAAGIVRRLLRRPGGRRALAVLCAAATDFDFCGSRSAAILEELIGFAEDSGVMPLRAGSYGREPQ